MSDQPNLGIADEAQRQRALDPAVSCIVQAPAGSGKTSLLTQRYLALLGQVEQPEAILGITFTRKAAAEMVERVLAALQRGQNPEPPEAPHERDSWRLARAALQRNADCQWRLLENPGRMRLQTIDAFCAALARQMPVVSEFGAPVAIQNHPEPLYQQAARQTLAELDSGQPWSAAIATLLRHLDNQVPKLEGLLAQMLARRDQWLRHVSGVAQRDQQRSTLESVLQDIVKTGVDKALTAISEASLPDLDALMQFASDQIEDRLHPIVLAAEVDRNAGSLADQHRYVLGVAQLLLTDKGTCRLQVDKKLGFPAPSSVAGDQKALLKSRKDVALQLLEQAGQQPDLLEALIAVRALPAANYSEQQWQIIEALLSLLPLAVAQLRLEFQRTGSVDFCEMAHAAERALGGVQTPTDLALQMDYQIQHVLVDEFQDTSETQFSLLSRLLSGWEPGGNRSLFLVGDPMQSIYRFRQAEVGLFLTAQRWGVGPMATLEPLTLSVNFRAQAGLVNWFNSYLPQVFPAADDLRLGAISYVPSTAFHPALPEDAVRLHPVLGETAAQQEAQQVCEQVLAIKQAAPTDSIAILVRGRAALVQLIPELKAQSIEFCAQEIDALAQQPLIKDLLALTHALMHPADRIAWLTVLRAPWCGLSLNDLQRLVGNQPHACVWDLMQDWERLGKLSAAGQTRLSRVCAVLHEAMADRQRQPLSQWVYATWMALAGPACVEDEVGLDDARSFFRLLSELEHGGEIIRAELAQRVTGLYAAPRSADDAVQIMTIHKSKGLEFDHVILPGLARKAGNDGTPLLNWLELPHEGASADSGEPLDLLLAPIHATGDEVDPTSRYLKQLHQAKSEQELTRLLYVAVTRARKRLHLWFKLSLDARQESVRAPQKGSLLHALWPAIESSVINAGSESLLAEDADQIDSMDNSDKQHEENELSNQYIKYLSDSYQMSSAPASIAWSPGRTPLEPALEQGVEFDWASELARQVGVVCHRALQWIATQGSEAWCALSPALREQYLQQGLQQEGVLSSQIESASARVAEMIADSLKDNRGQWVLNTQHTEQACELALTGVLEGQVIHGVLDRTFVDEAGVRWIVDYKTGRHAGADREAFMDTEVERYRWQLNRYARLMRLQEQRPIRLGLYFPAMSGWRQWDFDEDSHNTDAN